MTIASLQYRVSAPGFDGDHPERWTYSNLEAARERLEATAGAWMETRIRHISEWVPVAEDAMGMSENEW